MHMRPYVTGLRFEGLQRSAPRRSAGLYVQNYGVLQELGAVPQTDPGLTVTM